MYTIRVTHPVVVITKYKEAEIPWAHSMFIISEKLSISFYHLQTLQIHFIMWSRITYDLRLSGEPGSSVSIVTGNRLGGRGSIPDRGRGFFLWSLRPDGSGAHPASCMVGTRGSFPGGKVRPGRAADQSPLLVSRLRKSRSCTSCQPKRHLGM
jgi:hypothetical protein